MWAGSGTACCLQAHRGVGRFLDRRVCRVLDDVSDSRAHADKSAPPPGGVPEVSVPNGPAAARPAESRLPGTPTSL